jgi:REP element-mobilizing transposase RayT
MNNENTNISKNETFTWLEPGAWRKPCIVHVTMVANARQPLFGKLVHNDSEAMVEKTPIGWALINQQRRMLELCPEIKILADKVMPDHHHIVLQVQRTMSRSIREVVRGYMQGCKAEARRLGFSENLYDGTPFYRVLTHKGQLHAMIEYVKANTERAWQRSQNPELFRMRRKTEVCGLEFTSMGNHFLLDWPDKQLVEMSRSVSDEETENRLKEVLAAAHNGAVTYTAAISKGEQRIARTVREHGYPLVVLLNDGFPAEGSPHERFYKPGGVYFDACSRGKLLLMEPKESAFVNPLVTKAAEDTLRRKAEAKHYSYTPVPVEYQRYRFVALNEMGRIICGLNPQLSDGTYRIGISMRIQSASK